MLKNKVLDFIYKEAELNGFEVFLYDGYMAQYEGKDYSSGYMNCKDIDEDAGKPSIHAGVGGKPVEEWCLTLLHEYCHYLQYKEQCDVWKAYANSEGEDIPISVNLEYDCEKRTIELMKELGLANLTSIEGYTRRANSYLLFYKIYNITGEWYEKAPYSFPEIAEHMPIELKHPKDELLSPEVLALILSKCYKKEKGILDKLIKLFKRD